MINNLELKHVGPASSMQMNFAPRLNILTGDNGLGKTFIMDIVWFVLTQTWPKLPVYPNLGKDIKPEINYKKISKEKLNPSFKLTYINETQKWAFDKDMDTIPDGLVMYVRVDGGISIWDYAKKSSQSTYNEFITDKRPPVEAIHFSAQEILDGISDKGKIKCNGLIRDWINWQFQKKDLFSTFTKVLEILSPSTVEIIRPGEPRRISVDDAREIPTINLPYGNVPVTHISAGMQRILSLAYLMVWAWNEHQAASNLINQEPTNQFVILFDEVESHLHPQWQRSFMPALLEVIKILESSLKVQIFASTHAPLVLASLETEFCEDKDKILNFELTQDTVKINEIQWAKQGDVVGWLVSETFGLQQARSKKAEDAIEAAEAFMRNDMNALPENLKTKKDIHNELLRVLAGHDPFWPRWIVSAGEGL